MQAKLSKTLYGLLTFDPLMVGSQPLDLHSHNENQLVMIESKLIKNVLPSRYFNTNHCRYILQLTSG